MLVNPSALKRAQEEIDRVVGNERLPTFDDKADLPYIEHIVWECLRWNPGAWSRHKTTLRVLITCFD